MAQSSQDLSRSSVHEDAEEVPKFVPKNTQVASKASGPLVLKRRMTLTKEQIKTNEDKASATSIAKEYDTLLDCILCKTVMLDPRECASCRRGFCKRCVDDYVRQMIEGDYVVCCPNCSAAEFQLVEPHPFLKKTLMKLQTRCENVDKGCTVNVSYNDMATH